MADRCRPRAIGPEPLNSMDLNDTDARHDSLDSMITLPLLFLLFVSPLLTLNWTNENAEYKKEVVDFVIMKSRSRRELRQRKLNSTSTERSTEAALCLAIPPMFFNNAYMMWWCVHMVSGDKHMQRAHPATHAFTYRGTNSPCVHIK